MNKLPGKDGFSYTAECCRAAGKSGWRSGEVDGPSGPAPSGLDHRDAVWQAVGEGFTKFLNSTSMGV